MRQAGSFLILAAIAALATLSFLPDRPLTAGGLWAALALLVVAGGLIWLNRNRRHDD